MTVDALDLLTWAVGHEIVLDWHHDLAVDFEWRISKKIECVCHRAFSGVLNRDHTIVGNTALDVVKDISKTGLGDQLDAVAELAESGLVRPSACGPEVGDLEIFFQGKGGGHDLAVDCADGGVGQSPSFPFLAELAE